MSTRVTRRMLLAQAKKDLGRTPVQRNRAWERDTKEYERLEKLYDQERQDAEDFLNEAAELLGIGADAQALVRS